MKAAILAAGLAALSVSSLPINDAAISARLGDTDAIGQISSVGNYGHPYASNSVESSAASSRNAIRTSQDKEAGLCTGRKARRAAQPTVDECMGCPPCGLDVSGQVERRDVKESRAAIAGNQNTNREESAIVLGYNEPNEPGQAKERNVRRAAQPVPECMGCYIHSIDVLAPGQKEQRGVEESRAANIGSFQSANWHRPRIEPVKKG